MGFKRKVNTKERKKEKWNKKMYQKMDTLTVFTTFSTYVSGLTVRLSKYKARNTAGKKIF